MTDDSRIIWAYTEGHLREWMEGLHRYYSNGGNGGYHYQFPDPASLTSEQVEELYRRVKHILDVLGPFQSPVWRLFTPNRHSGESRNPEHSEHSDLLDSRGSGNGGLTLERPCGHSHGLSGSGD